MEHQLNIAANGIYNKPTDHSRTVLFLATTTATRRRTAPDGNTLTEFWVTASEAAGLLDSALSAVLAALPCRSQPPQIRTLLENSGQKHHLEGPSQIRR